MGVQGAGRKGRKVPGKTGQRIWQETPSLSQNKNSFHLIKSLEEGPKRVSCVVFLPLTVLLKVWFTDYHQCLLEKLVLKTHCRLCQ